MTGEINTNALKINGQLLPLSDANLKEISKTKADSSGIMDLEILNYKWKEGTKQREAYGNILCGRIFSTKYGAQKQGVYFCEVLWR